MSRLYLFNYNNYFNRIIKRGNVLSDYGTPIYYLEQTNFDYNDGVDAQHIINYEGMDGDYCVITDKNGVILSRWFVTENQRKRGGQHLIKLKRDLITDNFDKLIKAPVLINKAMISNDDSPLLFNTEGFSFNQIKQREILLKDRTKTPWYIMYFALNTASKTINISDDTGVPYDYAISVGIDDNSNPFKPGHYHYIDNEKYEVNFNPVSTDYFGLSSKYNSYKLFKNEIEIQTDDIAVNKFVKFDDSMTTIKDKLQTQFTSDKKSTMDTYMKNMITADDGFKTNEEFTKIDEMDRTFVLKSTNGGVTNYYTVRIQMTSTTLSKIRTKIYPGGSDLFNYVKNQIIASAMNVSGEFGECSVMASYRNFDIQITASPYEVPGSTYTFSLNFSGKATPTDAPYHIIAIPKYAVDVETEDSYICPQNINEAIVNGIINAYSDGASLLDVQLLPYFPYEANIPHISNQDQRFACVMEIDSDSTLIAKQYQLIGTANSGKCGVIFYMDKASFTNNINESITIPVRTTDSALNKKLSNELDIYRLCSPNYNGIFEFSVAKNNGVDYFNVDITLRPYNPYIHLNPNFKGIYGSDFDDARGLICQGDFSLPIITDPYKQYEYQNKNFLNVFNRQIEHMDFENEKNRQEALFGAITGTLTGGIGGAVAGSIKGGIGGAVGGGVAGIIASGIGGAVDYSILKERQAENKDLAIDMFKFNLGNIKALTYSINKVTPLTYNNKIWPFIEVYSATNEEQEILQNKIKYNSMTVNAIGSIEDYIKSDKTFISGSIIRLEEMEMPTHELNELYNEVLKGVYI